MTLFTGNGERERDEERARERKNTHDPYMILLQLNLLHLKYEQQDFMHAYCTYLYFKCVPLHNGQNVSTERDLVGGKSSGGSSCEPGNHLWESLLGAH